MGESVQAMNLQHAVLTSVNRDEQPDGGAWVFAESIYWIRRLQPGCTSRSSDSRLQGRLWPPSKL